MPRGRKKQSALSDINAPAAPLEQSESHPAPQPVQPNNDPVLLALQALTAKIESVETRLNTIDRGGVNLQEVLQQDSPADESVRPEPAARRVYNTPQAKPHIPQPVGRPGTHMREGAENDTPAVVSQVQYVQPITPNYAAHRRTIVPQKLVGTTRPVTAEEIRSIETESEFFLAAAGLTNVKGRPVSGSERTAQRSKRIIAVCVRCGMEHGKGGEWITSDMLQENGQFICNECLAGGTSRWQP
jgi:hypothetical protein